MLNILTSLFSNYAATAKQGDLPTGEGEIQFGDVFQGLGRDTPGGPGLSAEMNEQKDSPDPNGLIATESADSVPLAENAAEDVEVLPSKTNIARDIDLPMLAEAPVGTSDRIRASSTPGLVQNTFKSSAVELVEDEKPHSLAQPFSHTGVSAEHIVTTNRFPHAERQKDGSGGLANSDARVPIVVEDTILLATEPAIQSTSGSSASSALAVPEVATVDRTTSPSVEITTSGRLDVQVDGRTELQKMPGKTERRQNELLSRTQFSETKSMEGDVNKPQRAAQGASTTEKPAFVLQMTEGRKIFKPAPKQLAVTLNVGTAPFFDAVVGRLNKHLLQDFGNVNGQRAARAATGVGLCQQKPMSLMLPVAMDKVLADQDHAAETLTALVRPATKVATGQDDRVAIPAPGPAEGAEGVGASDRSPRNAPVLTVVGLNNSFLGATAKPLQRKWIGQSTSTLPMSSLTSDPAPRGQKMHGVRNENMLTPPIRNSPDNAGEIVITRQVVTAKKLQPTKEINVPKRSKSVTEIPKSQTVVIGPLRLIDVDNISIPPPAVAAESKRLSQVASVALRSVNQIVRERTEWSEIRQAHSDLVDQPPAQKIPPNNTVGSPKIVALPLPVMHTEISTDIQTRLTSEVVEIGEIDVFSGASQSEVRVSSGVTVPVGLATQTSRNDAAQVVRQLNEAVARGLDGIVELQLNPQELGRVRMSMAAGDQGLIVTISADRSETLDLLRRNIDQLARDLVNLGYDTPTFAFGDQGPNHTESPPQEDPEDIQTQDPKPERPAPLNVAASGLDLRI